MADLNRSIKVYIDNSDAMAKSQALETKISGLREELAKLNAQGQRDSKEHIATEKALAKLEKTYGNYKNKIAETERVLKNLSGSTYKELLAVKKTLKRELENETRGTESYTAKLKAYNAVQKEITVAQKEMNSQLGAKATFMSRATDSFNKYFGIVTSGLAAITGLSLTFRKLSQDAAMMEDVYADVMKTTGMTREEVRVLNEELKKIDTRTAREELNMIAEEGGRIGIAKDDILEFVNAMNIANVALGDSFSGGVEEIANKLGKLKMLFQETKDIGVEKAYLSIGSAINVLGAEGVASEQNITEFTTRLGALPNVLKPSIADTLALGAAFEESGIQAEIASRAYGIILNRATTQTADFARVMKMSVQEVEDLINKDPLEFFLKFSESLKGLNAVDTARLLNDLKINADGASKIIGAAANNTDRFRELLELSNDAFREGTSVIEEYNIKNNNAAAELEKRKKAFKDAAEELGNRLNPALLKSTNLVTYLVKLLPGFLDFMEKYGKYVLYLVTVYAAYSVATKIAIAWETKFRMALNLSNIVFTAKIALLNAAKIATAAYNMVMGLLTGNITKAREAWKLLNATMATNPIGLVLAAVTALAGGFILLQNHMSRAKNAKQAMDDISKNVAKSIAEERSQLDMLLATAKNENLSKEQRTEAIKKLNELSPEYLGNLSLENINTKEATDAVNDYTEALMRNAQQKAISDKLSEVYGEKLEKEATIAKYAKLIEEDKAKGLMKSNMMTQSAYATRIKLAEASLVGINKEIEAYKELGQTIEQSNKPTKTPVTTKNNDLSGGGGYKPEMDEKELEKIYQKKLTALQKYINEEKNILAQKRIDGIISELEYTRQLELLETERLSRTLDIYEIGSEKRAEIENLIFQHKLKMLKAVEDEEKKLNEKLLELQKKETEAKKKADEERAKNNLKALKKIAKQNEDNYKAEFEREKQRKAELTALAMDFSNEMGEMLGNAILGNEDLVASSLKTIINMGLDMLKVQVQMAVAGATAQSLAQADSVATFGATGLARAAILVGLIEAAFAAVKTVIGGVIGKIGNSSSSGSTGNSVTGSRVVTQRAAGKYDVIGADDGRHYNSVPYAGVARTGYVSTPTLMGETGRELVVSAPDLSRLQRHINYPLIISAINDARSGVVPQRESGNYNSIPLQEPSSASQFDPVILNEIRELLIFLKNNPLKAYVVLSELQRQQNKLNKSQNIGRK